jgi:hypothetical protein
LLCAVDDGSKILEKQSNEISDFIFELSWDAVCLEDDLLFSDLS